MRSRIGLALAVLLVIVGSADAKKQSKLRHEIEMLQARVAQLESRLQFESRRVEQLLPTVIGVVGGLCADPCATDSDADGVGDCEDLCPCDPANADDDSDGMPNCYDPCPDDATDACIDPCRHDSDGDGTNDCEDACPWDPNPPADADNDGIPDCADPCPDGTLGCTEPCPLDADGDGTKDCVDPCPYGAEGKYPCIGMPPGTPAGS
jgi:hypothetical protein